MTLILLGWYIQKRRVKSVLQAQPNTAKHVAYICSCLSFFTWAYKNTRVKPLCFMYSACDRIYIVARVYNMPIQIEIVILYAMHLNSLLLCNHFTHKTKERKKRQNDKDVQMWRLLTEIKDSHSTAGQRISYVYYGIPDLTRNVICRTAITTLICI